MCESLRVGVFNPTLKVYGGGEFVTATIANTLAQNNYEVYVSTNEKINQHEIEKFFGKRIHISAKVIVKPTAFQPKGLFDFYQTIFRSYIFKSKCDVWIDVYSNRVFPWTNVCYVHFPYLNHYVFNRRFPYLKSSHMRPVATIPYVFFEKNIVNYDGKLVLANSHYTAEEIRKFCGENVEVLYPPVPSIIFDNDPKDLVESPRKDLVVTISRFEPNKGLEKIPYIASLTEAHISFAIIGRVHYKNTLLSLQKTVKKLGLTERVKFFTDIPKHDMKEILKSAKTYLHTMVGEQFGISVVEAMAMGCIPVVHDSGGTREFVPIDLRYENIYDAAEKIRKCMYGWFPSKVIEVTKIAERFREENFSNQFIKLFEGYLANK